MTFPAENNSEFADDKLINPLRSEKEFSYQGSCRTADRRIVAGTGARAWVGRNEFSDFGDNLEVRKVAKSGPTVSTSNLFTIILPNSIHQSKKWIKK